MTDVDTGAEPAAPAEPATNDDPAAAVAAIADTPPAAPTPDPGLGWMFAAGVQGEGDAPEWFKSDKYKTVADQAEAYTALESKFGSFTGAPEDYAIAVSEELAEKGVELDSDDPLMVEALKFAKESNMNQDGFNRMINLYAMSQLANQEAVTESREDEMKALGDSAQSRVDNIAKWGTANLSEDQFKGLQEMANSAEAVKTIEKLISMTRSAPMSPDNTSVPSPVSEDEVRSMQFEKDEYGNRRIHTDKAFAADFRKKYEQLWGSQEHRQIIG